MGVVLATGVAVGVGVLVCLLSSCCRELASRSSSRVGLGDDIGTKNRGDIIAVGVIVIWLGRPVTITSIGMLLQATKKIIVRRVAMITVMP